uniref:Uncharacterized protein n=1 Tax=Onchocerca volvulus TaxID=6282 RepID=A0A8R1TRI0_ONCVO
MSSYEERMNSTLCSEASRLRKKYNEKEPASVNDRKVGIYVSANNDKIYSDNSNHLRTAYSVPVRYP